MNAVGNSVWDEFFVSHVPKAGGGCMAEAKL